MRTPEDREILARQVVENWQRAELHPYDLADALARMRDTLGYSQKEIAALTGKPESEISRLLSLLRVNPLIQREARKDTTGLLSRRHLAAIAQLDTEEQQEVMIQIRDRRMTAVDTEKLVQDTRLQKRGETKRGAPTGAKFRYTTPAATVTLAFRNKDAGGEDVLKALADVWAQIEERGASPER